ncbi:MAG: hypothetical protein AAF591_08700 [Verrucomicrobiota bacterium]
MPNHPPLRPKRKHLPHEPPHWVADTSTYFITINTEPKGVPQLCSAPVPPSVSHSILDTVDYYHHHGNWTASLAILMPDHLHALLSFPEQPGLKTTIRNWKRYLAKTHRIVWQEDFFDHRIRDDNSLREKWFYILNNPVRKSLCESPEDWPFTKTWPPR